MSTEAPEIEPSGRFSPASHFKRFGRGAAGAAGRIRSFLRAPGIRKRTSTPGEELVHLDSLSRSGSRNSAEDRLAEGQWSRIRSRSVTRAAEAGTFPCQLCIHTPQSVKACQDLVTTGSRLFGLGSLLKVRIYDFAVYVHPEQAKYSMLAKQSLQPILGGQHARFCQKLRSSDDIDMSLMVRAARNLPIKLLAKEYERILRRRLKKLGGSQTDAALAQMIKSFDEKALPDSIKQGGSVKKGTLLTFTKQGPGSMVARANGQHLLSVNSPKLCQAVFDLYLGDQPVSKDSRQAAGDAVLGMMGSIPYQLPADKGLCKVDGNSCQVLT